MRKKARPDDSGSTYSLRLNSNRDLAFEAELAELRRGVGTLVVVNFVAADFSDRDVLRGDVKDKVEITLVLEILCLVGNGSAANIDGAVESILCDGIHHLVIAAVVVNSPLESLRSAEKPFLGPLDGHIEYAAVGAEPTVA